MIIFGIILLVFGCAVLIFRKTLRLDLFHPIVVLTLQQSFTLGFSMLSFERAMTPFEPITILSLISLYISFSIGGYIGTLWAINSIKRKQFKDQETNYNYNWTRHFKISVFLMLINLLVFVKVYITIGGVTLLVKNAGKHLSQGIDIGYLNLFMVSAYIAVQLLFIGGTKLNPHIKIRRVSMLLALLLFGISVLFYPARMNIVLMILPMILYYNICKKQIKSLYVFSGIALFLGLFMALALMREQTASILLFELIYKYIANNYWNLDFALYNFDTCNSCFHTWGFSLVEGFLNIYPDIYWPFKTALMADTFNNESIQKVKFLNTVSSHWILYRDFSFLGWTLLPFLFGNLCSYLYMLTVRYKSPHLILIMGILTYSVTMSFFLAPWQRPDYALWIIIVLSTIKLCYKPSSN